MLPNHISQLTLEVAIQVAAVSRSLVHRGKRGEKMHKAFVHKCERTALRKLERSLLTRR